MSDVEAALLAALKVCECLECAHLLRLDIVGCAASLLPSRTHRHTCARVDTEEGQGHAGFAGKKSVWERLRASIPEVDVF